MLTKNKITHILNISNDLKCHFPVKFQYKQVKVDDDEEENLLIHFSACNQFI